jgi:ATP-dependent Lon protease
MNKRLTRTDYLFALMFIFMLVCILGAFFYGLEIGKQKSDQKYEKLLNAGKEVIEEPGAYNQQVLVSFYHTIYLPFREFQNKWFDQMGQIETNKPTSDASAILKELSKISQEKSKELQGKTMPNSSPLLQQAHQSYLKSLTLFADTLNNYQSKANSMPSGELLSQMDKDSFFLEAKNQALLAQKDYYDSIVKWNETMDYNLEKIDIQKTATLEVWKKMNLNVKNLYVANQLLAAKSFVPYYPQDVTIRIDDFIASGQAQKLSAADANQTINLLFSTNAIRSGDFVKGKSKWYANELLPQLPFFSDIN